MPQVLAVCDHCGHFFQSGTGVDPGGTGVTFTLTVESAPRICPRCGQIGHVLGGAYYIAEDTIELLQGPERTISELQRLREILREARNSGASSEEVQTTIRREFPEWGSALANKLLIPKTPADFYALIAVILMVLDMVLGAKQTGQTINIQADQVINNIIVQAPPTPGQTPVTLPAESANLSRKTIRKRKKIGRNAPCPCSSGKKYKKCCGDPTK